MKLLEVKPDLLLITVNKHETQAIMQAFEAATGQKAVPMTIENRIYRDLGIVNGTRVFHSLSEMASGGLGASHATTMKAIAALHPKAVIAIGIAFGTKPDSQEIGDILISRQLSLYELQRISEAKLVARGDRPHASTWLINYFDGVWQTTWNSPAVHIGVMLSGEKLVDNIDFRDQLLDIAPESLGGEMEGAGVYAASQEEKIDWIVIKAICDWADGKKNEDKEARQKTAAKNASEFLVHSLQSVRLFSEDKSAAIQTQILTPSLNEQSKPVSRITNLKLKATFTDSERDIFLEEAFESIANEFKKALTELESAHDVLKTNFRKVDSNSFTCVIYRKGTEVARCKIKLNGKGITYSHDYPTMGDGYNEELRVANDDYNLYLKAYGMAMLDDRDLDSLTFDTAANYYLDILLRPLK